LKVVHHCPIQSKEVTNDLRLITFLNTKTSGKTALLSNFAITLARKTNESVALVDLNIFTPELAHYFNLIDEQKRVYPISLDEIFRYLLGGEEFDIKTVVTTFKTTSSLSLICGPGDMRVEFSRLQETQWQYLVRKLSSFDYVLVDTPRYQDSSLFRVLLKESGNLILVQDQDLFGAYHSAHLISSLPSEIKEKVEFWLSRYEENSLIKPKQIEEIIDLNAKYLIPGIPRSRYIQCLLKEKPFGQDVIPGYTDKLMQIADELLGIEAEKKEGRSWKFWTWKRKSITT